MGGDPQDGEEGDGKQAGQGAGEHALEVDVTLDELAAILGEELELPDIQDKGKSKIINAKDRYTSIRRVGPESLRNFKRTYREALKRQICDGHLRAGQPRRRAHPGRQALPQLEDRGRARRQRRHHLHDGRLRLDGRRAEGDRPHRELLDRCVAAAAIQGPREPLHHPRRRGARGRPRDLLPHARERRHHDLERVQALLAAHRRPLPAGGVEHLPLPFLRRRQLVDGRHAALRRRS